MPPARVIAAVILAQAFSSSSQHTVLTHSRSVYLLAQQFEMANRDIGIIALCLCFVAPAFTLLLGIVYVVLRPENWM